MRSQKVKRLLDLLIAGALLVVLAGPMVVLALVIVVTTGRPVLFRHRRPGLHGAPFELLKFRTMRPADHDRPEEDADRLTPLGRWLRSTSLDELPSLVNVVRGDMSLVGPRPLLERYLERYSSTEARRHEVRPGLTGLAQLAGRNALTWDEQLALDVRYVDTWTVGGDLRLLWDTAGAVLRRQGISEPGQATRSELRPPSVGD